MQNAALIRSVLIVDDDPFDSLIIERNLRAVMNDVDIKVVNDSRKALDAFLTLKPDLVLLDISMPHLNGFDVLQAISASNDNLADDSSSVVMLSGSTSSEDKRRALDMGAVAYRVKPSSLAGYLELAGDLLSRKASGDKGGALLRQAIVNSLSDLVRRRTHAHRDHHWSRRQSIVFQSGPR
ncbi:MAG: response regulator [Pseudomonadota bacterium]